MPCSVWAVAGLQCDSGHSKHALSSSTSRTVQHKEEGNTELVYGNKTEENKILSLCKLLDSEQPFKGASKKHWLSSMEPLSHFNLQHKVAPDDRNCPAVSLPPVQGEDVEDIMGIMVFKCHCRHPGNTWHSVYDPLQPAETARASYSVSSPTFGWRPQHAASNHLTVRWKYQWSLSLRACPPPTHTHTRVSFLITRFCFLRLKTWAKWVSTFERTSNTQSIHSTNRKANVEKLPSICSHKALRTLSILPRLSSPSSL